MLCMIVFANGCCENKSSKNKGRIKINPDDLIMGSEVENEQDIEIDKTRKKSSRKKTVIAVYEDDLMLKKDEEEEKSSKDVDYDKLRKKANVAEAGSLVGYDGKKIKKDLNKIIDEKEKEAKQYKDLGL